MNEEHISDEIYNVEDYEIWTDSGWQNINQVMNTKPLESIKIILEDNFNIECSIDHILFCKDYIEKKAKNLTKDDFVITEYGLKQVKKVEYLNKKEVMYDLNVDGQRYFGNGILNHNSVVVGAYALWFSTFNKDKFIGIGSNKMDSAKSLLSKIKIMYEEMPYWMKPGVVSYAKTHVHFDNGSKIVVSSTSPDSFRGESINLLVLDEFAFVDCADEFWTSTYPTLSSMKSSKIIIISTPNGMFNLFHKLWVDAENNKNTFVTHFAPWYARPDRDEEWKNKQLKNMSKIEFTSEHECKFLGSTSTVIYSNVLKILMNKYKEPKFLEMNDCFRIWEKPEKDKKYILGVDCSEGIGQDYSVIQVLKIEQFKPAKFKQVAVYSSNEIDTFTFAGIINKVCYYYNEAYIMLENNSIGNAVANELVYNLDNYNLINNHPKKHGINANNSTKTKAVLTMKKLIENNDLELIDEQTIDELCTFIEKGGKYFGDSLHDDHISALYWACYIMSFPDYFIDDELRMNKVKDDDEEIWGFLTQVEVNKEDWSWL